MLESDTFHALTLWSLIAMMIQFGIITGVTLRVMLTRHPPGSAFAWIIITSVIPYVGFVLYLMFGERPLGRHREQLYRSLHEKEVEHPDLPLIPVGPLPLPLYPRADLLALATSVSGFPVTFGSSLKLFSDTNSIFNAIVADINTAQKSIDMEFYIWLDKGRVDEVSQALFAALARGCRVRILLDDFGSRAFLNSTRRKELVSAGAEICPAMPMKLWQIFGLQRADLRLHRKSIIIDERIAYTGSLNMIDPSAYADAKIVGDWIDAMVRMEGPAVDSQCRVFETDWLLQPSQKPMHPQKPVTRVEKQCGNATLVTVPSGPYSIHDPNLYLLLEAIAAAKRSITITTPYFVPNEALLTALQTAAFRGVKITLIVPKKGNNKMVTWAGRRPFDTLLNVGVEIQLHRIGLLHTKSVAVDGEFAVFGTVNLDNRSLHLNFETALLIFDTDFMLELDALHQSYFKESDPVNPKLWAKRPLLDRLKEGIGSLVAPLL